MIFLLSKSKWLLRTALYVAVLFLLLSIYYLLQTGSYPVFPLLKKSESGSAAFAYDDREQGGSSFSKIIVNEEVIDLKFDLGAKYIYPYAGVSFPILPTENFQLTTFNTLHISLNVPAGSKILVILSQHKKQAGMFTGQN